MSYSLMIAPFDFANHKKIAAQQFRPVKYGRSDPVKEVFILILHSSPLASTSLPSSAGGFYICFNKFKIFPANYLVCIMVIWLFYSKSLMLIILRLFNCI